MKKKITSRELATLAGVSSATISRAFSTTARINEATRERILAIAREHNYQPNAIARTLNSQTSRLVALVVNTIGNPCEAEELNELVRRLQERELLPIILCCAEYRDRLQLMRLASTYQVDHVVIFSDMVTTEDALEIFRGVRPIIVTFEPLDEPAVSTIQVDGVAAVEEIIAKVVGDGRRHFAYIAGRSSSWIDNQRQDWFSTALAAHGLKFEAFGRGDYSYEAGFKEAVLLLRRYREIDALICGNDVMAIGACDAARRVLGRQIPEELAVVGQDGIAMASWESHDLTTLAQDHTELMNAVIELIEQDAEMPGAISQIRLPCSVRWGTTA
jgi:DNA-binding LacI/PurR family transcriptional regulator